VKNGTKNAPMDIGAFLSLPAESSKERSASPRAAMFRTLLCYAIRPADDAS